MKGTIQVIVRIGDVVAWQMSSSFEQGLESIFSAQLLADAPYPEDDREFTVLKGIAMTPFYERRKKTDFYPGPGARIPRNA